MAYNYQAAIVRDILPKANEIVDTAQQNFKSIYPFELKKTRHVSDTKQLNNTSHTQYKKQVSLSTFKPIKRSVKQLFSKKYLVYDKFNNNFDEEIFNVNIFPVDKLKNLKNNDFIIHHGHTQQFVSTVQQNQLIFDSRFQCGNLSMASKIEDQYFLLLHNDVNTNGYTNWFYFTIQPKNIGRYKLAIVNYGKAGWPFNSGTGMCCKVNKQWKRAGQNIICQKNTKLFMQSDTFAQFNTLSFEFQFKSCQSISFAYNIPYSYTDLLSTLDNIQRQAHPYYHRKLAGTTICGNRIQMLTIGNFQKHKQSRSSQSHAIVLFGRAHPGETISSWIMHYFLLFILSDRIQAKILRDRFVFKVFPMINPDGVIHGNYRCSLVGRDLNRRWNKSIKELYPEVYYIKNQILQLSQKKPIKMVIDLHGHTQKRQAFFFGCNDKNQPHKCRLFPYLLSKISQNYDFNSCNFAIDKCKLSTARITLFMLLKNCDVFTLETSQYGTKDHIFDSSILRQIGESLVKGLYYYFKLNKLVVCYQKNQKSQLEKLQSKQFFFNEKSQELSRQNIPTSDNPNFIDDRLFQFDTDKIQKQIMENNALLKLGNQKDDGSDSQPSVCNINFDSLKKMCHRKQMHINTQTNRNAKVRKNVNRVLISGRKQLELNKKSIDLLPNTQKNKILPLPKRFASTSHSFRKNSEDCSEYHNLTKTSKVPLNKIKSQSQRGISTPSISRNRKTATQQLVKMINFQLSFEGFNSQRSSLTKRKLHSTNNDILNSMLDIKINNFVNYTQPSLIRPYSFLYKNKR